MNAIMDDTEVEFLNERTRRRVEELLPDANTLRSISDFYSIFSDSTRLKIISALAIREMCVNDLSELLRANQSTVSHQLKLLRDAGIVDYRRCGKMILYFVCNLLIDDVMSIGIENMRNEIKIKY